MIVYTEGNKYITLTLGLRLTTGMLYFKAFVSDLFKYNVFNDMRERRICISICF